MATAEAAGASVRARCLAAAVVAEPTFTEPALRRAIAKATLRPASIPEPALSMAFVTVAALRTAV